MISIVYAIIVACITAIVGFACGKLTTRTNVKPFTQAEFDQIEYTRDFIWSIYSVIYPTKDNSDDRINLVYDLTIRMAKAHEFSLSDDTIKDIVKGLYYDFSDIVKASNGEISEYDPDKGPLVGYAFTWLGKKK